MSGHTNSSIIDPSLSPELRVPKREAPADLVFADGSKRSLILFLGDRMRTRVGSERPSDLLNKPEPFFPARAEPGTILFFHRDAVLLLRVSAEYEFGESTLRIEELAPQTAQSLAVIVKLENGEEIQGCINYVMPEGKMRLLDFLNMEERFLTLRTGDDAVLINKRRIIRVCLP